MMLRYSNKSDRQTISASAYCLPDGETLETLFLVHHTHGSEHVVLKAVGTVQLQGSLSCHVIA